LASARACGPAHGAVDDWPNQRFKDSRSIPEQKLPRGAAESAEWRFLFRKLVLDGDKVFAQLLRKFGVRREIDAVFLKNFLVNESLQQIIDVVAAEVRVAVGGKHLVDIAFAGGDEL